MLPADAIVIPVSLCTYVGHCNLHSEPLIGLNAIRCMQISKIISDVVSSKLGVPSDRFYLSVSTYHSSHGFRSIHGPGALQQQSDGIPQYLSTLGITPPSRGESTLILIIPGTVYPWLDRPTLTTHPLYKPKQHHSRQSVICHPWIKTQPRKKECTCCLVLIIARHLTCAIDDQDS